jgi:hypothetical protein
VKQFFAGLREEEPEEGYEPNPGPAESPVLYVPRAVISDTHQHLVPYWKARIEAACFWFGVEVGSVQVVTTLALTELLQTAGSYRVLRESLRRLSKEMRSQGLVNLAQIHTHPRGWVGHSTYDDEHAYSTRDGSLSLVWPDYGFALAHDLAGIGVHERRDDRWVRLAAEEIGRRVRIVDSVSDQRWKVERGDLEDVE